MINVAIIGFGFMGITHAVNILRNEKLKLRAIITRNVQGVPEKLNGQIGNFSSGERDPKEILAVPVYKTLDQCLKNEKIDAVHICVHTDLHYEIAREALERGLHVLLEKPFCLRVEDGMLLIALARHQNLKLMVGHVLRFMPAYRKLKQWIDNRQFGALKFISLSRFSGLPSWGQWKQKQEQFGSSGGALFDLVIHDIDFLHYALGTPLKIESYSFPGALSANDYVSAQWHYDSIRAKIDGGNTFHSSFPFQAGYVAQFENASVCYSSRMPSVIQVCDDENIHEFDAGDANDGFYNEIDYFASCIQDGAEPVECTPRSSLKTIELCYRHL